MEGSFGDATARERAPRWQRILRPWWVRIFVLPLFVLATLHAAGTVYLGTRFRARVDVLRGAAEPVRYADLIPPPIREQDNAASLLAEADRWYEEHLLADEEHNPMSAWDYRNSDELDVDESAARASDLAERRGWLARGDPYVEMLSRAAAKPALRQDLDWTLGWMMPVPTGEQFWRAGSFLGERVSCAERATPRVLSEIGVYFDLARKFERHCLLLVLMRWSHENAAAEALQSLARKPGFDAAQARRELEERLSTGEDSDLWTAAFRGERVTGLNFVGQWVGGENPLRLHAEVEEDGSPPVPRWSAPLGTWLGRPLAYLDGLRFLDLMEEAQALSAREPRDAVLAAQELANRYRTPVISVASHLWALLPGHAARERLRHQAVMRVARVGLALLQRRQESGAWPEDLDAVLDLVGAEALIDPFTGGRLRYEPGVRVEAEVPLKGEALRYLDGVAWRF